MQQVLQDGCHQFEAYELAQKREHDLQMKKTQSLHLRRACDDSFHREIRDDASSVRLDLQGDSDAQRSRDGCYRLRMNRWNRWYP